MKRTIMIMLATILIMSLIINSYANAQEEAPEDILLYPDVYMPRVVSSYDLETPSSIGQGSVFPVFVTLKGIKTNPIVEISKIDSIRITLDQSSSKYSAAPRHLAPKSRTYTLDNMGYLIVNLKKDPLKKDENIPSSIDLNLKATIYYKVNTGFGVFPQDVILKELSEQEFNSQRAQYNFWNTRGYLRLIKLENGIATISVYDERGNKITTLEPLSPGQTSRQFTLRRLYFEDEQELKFRDRAKIRFIKTISGEKAANLQILFNNQLQFIQRFEREQLYPGSAWRIKSITSSPQINQVVLENTATDEIKTLYKNQKSEIDCKQLTSQEDCILINQCQWTGTNCVSKKEQTTTQLSVQTQPSIDDSAAKTEFENLKKQHSQVQEKINKLSDEEIKNKASELISEIKSLENGYFSFMDKYSAPVWLSLARHRLLNSQVPFYISVWTLYDKLEEITNDRETYEKLKNELLARDKNYHDKVYITSETEAVSKDSREYYLDAIRNYENVANSYPEVKDDQGNELGPIAQSRIAEIYQNNLNDFGKASSSYKKLLNEFSSSEYVKSQQEIIKRWIELLEDRANYNINAEQIIEDGNIIDVALNDIAAVGEGSKAFIEINNLVKKEGYKLGDSPIPGWVIDEIN
ncbi:hypothetical protein HYX18_00305, partial [Candidatus Woesearchaeota archaeon]|nr:hypothetical protein [Candidatus Woesearchaeota archaeon]